MSKKIVIFILAFLSCAAFCAGAARQTPLRDGFLLAGVDGKLTNTNGKWFFEFDSDVSDDTGRISAGSIIELLPSTILEKMTVDAQNRSDASYRLWGNVTKYRGSNFIFPIYFLPISSINDRTKPEESLTPSLSEGRGPTSQQQKTEMPINEPNDVLAMPEEIIGKLKTRRILRHEQLKEGLQLKQDYVLADRTALLDNSTGEPVAVLDAIGRNIPQISFRLLPCQVLERAQRRQSVEADPIRFKIAGILTQYKGEYYLLLQKATRAYSHENFGR